MRRALGDIAVSSLPHEVRVLWYTRHNEPEKEEFVSLPDWMDQEPPEWPQSRDLGMVVSYLMTTITKREAFVLLRRFWFEDTLDELGESMEVSGARVRQIEQRALRKLRHPSKATLFRLAVDLPDHLI